MLKIDDIKTYYGNIQALKGISLEIGAGEIICLIGANGAGKSTTLMAISGLVKVSEGSILFDGEPLHKLPAHDIVARGVAQAPEGRRVFGTLTVRENLNLGAYTSNDQQKINQNRDWVFELFPRLKERRNQMAGTLSGGEQQMLAVGRALMGNPRILLLDEPSLGLAPLLVKTIFDTVRQINQAGVTVVLVEQNARAALKLANRGYVMEVGHIVLKDSAANLLADPEVQSAYLGGKG
jgi:branched-chain amino acid transport system ATP-binding protein